MLCSSPALALSPQPEYISPALLFEAEQERTDLRYEIRLYFDFTEFACPTTPTEKYQDAFSERDRNFENFISSLQDTQLMLDANIAVQDGQKNAFARQSVVDCGTSNEPGMPGYMNDAGFETQLTMAENQLKKIKSAAQIAMARLGMEEDE